MKRLGALVLAVAMVAAAFVARAALGTDDQDELTAGGDEQPVGIICASDLADRCSAAAVPVAGKPQAGDTADALIAADDPSDLGGSAWLVTEAWASVVLAERERLGREPLFEVAGDALASSGAVLAVWEGRAQQLAARCELATDAALGWGCVAEQAGTELEGGRVRVAGPDIESAAGLVVAAAQSVGFFTGTDFSLADFDTRGFRSVAAELSSRTTDSPVRKMRAEGPGQITAAGSLAVEATNLASTFGTVATSTPEPPVRADVVLVVPGGTEVPEQQRVALADALQAAGWDPPSTEPSGLPSGGVLAAIRTLWSQNR